VLDWINLAFISPDTHREVWC